MKENRKLLKDVLDDIRQDMSDEEVLSLLADRKISVRPESEKKIHFRTTSRRCYRKICRQLGVHFFVCRRSCSLDGYKYHNGVKSI